MIARALSLGRLYGEGLARRWLAACDRVGREPVLSGKPRLENQGRLVIGDHFQMSSRPVQSHLIVKQGASLSIGDHVRIESGAGVSCQCAIEIGNSVSIGAFSMLMDSDFHVAGDSGAWAAEKPIRVGAGARIGHRVIVLPGSTIGAGARVRAGSIVSGDVPDGASVAGNPARAAGDESAAQGPASGPPSEEIPELVRRVLGLREVPSETSGPDQIPGWDSLGALRLILALEERFEVTLREDEIKRVACVGDLSSVVEAAQARRDAPKHGAF